MSDSEGYMATISSVIPVMFLAGILRFVFRSRKIPGRPSTFAQDDELVEA